MYNVLDWYWAVDGSTTEVWASARASYVSSSDSLYQAWLATHPDGPTAIGSAAELVAVILQQWLPVISGNGVVVVGDSDSSLSGTYAIDQTALGNITALSTGIAAGKPLPSGADTFKYRDVAGTAHLFSATAFTDFAAAIEAYVYAVEDAVEETILGTPTALPTQPIHFG